MKCKTSDWGCIYHACMSDHCQKSIMLRQGCDEGPGKCEKFTPVQLLADKIIYELEEAGLTPDQMIKVIKMAREKYKALGGVVKPNTNMERIPKIGDVVIYNTTKQEQEDMENCPPASNNVAEKLPAIIVAVWGDKPDSLVNLKVIHDGTSLDLWKTSVQRGDNEMNWNFPKEDPAQE